MMESIDDDGAPGKLSPERTFVIQLRSGSDFGRRRVRGRIEHVVSGDSEPFGSLDEAVAFMSRHLPPPATTSDAAARVVRTAKRKGKR